MSHEFNNNTAKLPSSKLKYWLCNVKNALSQQILNKR